MQDYCKHGTESLGSVKVGEFPNYLSYCWFLINTELQGVCYMKILHKQQKIRKLMCGFSITSFMSVCVVRFLPQTIFSKATL